MSRIKHLAAATALLALACGRAQVSAPRAVRVALVMKTLNSPFFIDMQSGARAAARRLGVDLTVQAAEREIDVDKQMQIIENLIQTGIQVLCVTPSGSKELVPAIAKANRAGVAVVIVDTRLDSDAAREAGVHIDTFIGSDNYEGGRLAGRYLVESSGGDARVAILEGIPGHETADSRAKGFRDAVRDAPRLKIVASQTANWERDQGFTVFQNMLQAHPEVDALFACNDMMALGAVEAIAAAGRTGKIRVIGFDAVEDARRAIKEGVLVASVAQLPSEMGRIAVESAVKLTLHDPVPAEQPVRIEMVTRASLAGAAGKQ